MTPKRPDATCLTADRRRSPFSSATNRSASSPPSPLFDFAPMRFIAIASVSCASAEIDPYDIAPVAKRFTISATGSTSSIGTGGRSGVKSNNPRSVPPSRLSRSTLSVYSSNSSKRRCRVACCSRNTVSGLNRWISPSRRHWYSPPTSSRRCAFAVGTSGYAVACRAAASSASTSSPTPPSRDAVAPKYSSTSGFASPNASNTCAPVYDAIVEMPIFDITFKTPFDSALT